MFCNTHFGTLHILIACRNKLAVNRLASVQGHWVTIFDQTLGQVQRTQPFWDLKEEMNFLYVTSASRKIRDLHKVPWLGRESRNAHPVLIAWNWSSSLEFTSSQGHFSLYFFSGTSITHYLFFIRSMIILLRSFIPFLFIRYKTKPVL